MFLKIKYVFIALIQKILSFLKLSIILLVFFSLLFIVFMVSPNFSDAALFVMNKIPITVNTRASKQPAKTIVILGGGLRKKSNNEIVLNKYTKQRLQTVVKLHHKKNLPIFFSGVEAKWAKQWLLKNKVSTQQLILEGKSMNTCENANFSAIKLKSLGINHIYLITDAYHQQRARLNFARNGIYTTAISASLGNKHRAWDTPKLNFDNSRRALYEIIAILRDKYKPQQGKACLLKPKKSTKPNFSEFNLKQLIEHPKK